jgi:polyhydroxyalkanoate synthesis regulator phasin
MFDVLKRFALIGLGALSFSEEKLKQCIDDLIKRGEVSEEEGDDLLKKFTRRAEEEKDSIEEWMKEKLGEILKKMDIVSREDIGRLEKELKSLDKRIKELKKEVKKGD